MKKCKICDGSGQVYNKKWDEEWDRLDQKFPAHDIVNREIEKSGIPKHVQCDICTGSGNADPFYNFRELAGKQIKEIERYNSGLPNATLRITFEDNTYLHVPINWDSAVYYVAK